MFYDIIQDDALAETCLFICWSCWTHRKRLRPNHNIWSAP